MATQHFCRRSISAMLVGGAVLAAVTWATPARADAATFLKDLHNARIYAVTGGDPALLQMGADICQQLSWGAPPNQLQQLAVQRSDSRQGAGGITPQQADDIVGYAARDLCPNG